MSHNVGKEIGEPVKGMSARDCRLSARLGRLRASLCRDPMGDRSRSNRSSGLLLVRLASLVAALLVLCVSSRASANQVIPMCGERGESIAAPPIFRAHDSGSIVVAPCSHEQLEAAPAAPLAPERLVVQERPERALSFASLCLSQAVDARLPITIASYALRRPGFARLVDRPPRA